MNYKTYKLNNGLSIVFVPDKKIKLIYINIGVKIGSDTETIKTLELSHFMEHLFTLLTSSKYSDGLYNRNLLSKYNIEQNAQVVTKNTDFQYVMKKKYLSKFLDMLIHSLADFTIDEKLFINEKNSVIEELNAIINDTDYKFESFVDKILFKNHTRHYSQELRLKNVKNVQGKDILNFFKEFYTPDNIVISFFGDVDQQKTVDLFNQYNMPYTNTKLYLDEKKFKLNNSKRIYHLKEKKNTCNLKIVFNIPYTFFDYEYYCIFSIINILTYDISSILINRLRNKEGLIYDLSGYMDLDENTNQLSFIYFETNVESDKIVKVIKIIMEELDKIKEGLLDESLIKRYRESLKIKYIRDSLTFQPMKLIDEYTKYILWGKKIVTFKDEYTNFGAVNKNNIKKIANKIFDFRKIFIFYNGLTNYDSEINKIF
jgi:predicted Zn-dependent peptidase